MPTVTEQIVLSREEREQADERFRQALRDGRQNGMSWSELATVSGLSRTHVRYLTLNLNERRQIARKGEQNGDRAEVG